MEWIEYKKGDNLSVGRYLVKTLTMMGNVHRLECTYLGKNWSCSNQIVTHYLKHSHE